MLIDDRAMGKYKVRVRLSVYKDYDVVADSEDEALDKAVERSAVESLDEFEEVDGRATILKEE